MSIKAKKVKKVFKLCWKFDVLGLGELHGDPAAVLSSLAFVKRSHEIFISLIKDPHGNYSKGTGGIAILVRRSIICRDGPWDVQVFGQEIVPGRIGKIIRVLDKNARC